MAENVPRAKRARTPALDPKTQRVYVVMASFGFTPEATKDYPRLRPPDSFALLVLGKQARERFTCE